VHDVHRRATSLLAELLALPAVPPLADDFCQFVVEMLEHHHTCEDRDLWPLITTIAPDLRNALHGLTVEHDDLQAGLDRLRVARIQVGRSSFEAGVVATVIRDRVHEHLGHEEPVLFPALGRHVSDSDWDDFSKRTVASAPQTGLPFLLALLHEVGTAADIELIFRHVPTAARALIPERRAAGEAMLAELRTRVGTRSGGRR
jgi:hemerythrin-like domain-containing protein